MNNKNTNEIIVASLINLLSDDNLSNISVKDISTQANISRQTFYRHFKDKYDVINWFYDKEIESLFISTHSVDGIKNNLILKCRKYKQNMELYKRIYHCDGQNSLANHEFHRIYDSLSKKIYKSSGLKIDEHSEALQYSISFYCHGLIHTTIDWLSNNCQIPCETFAEIIIQAMPLEIVSKLKAFD